MVEAAFTFTKRKIARKSRTALCPSMTSPTLSSLQSVDSSCENQSSRPTNGPLYRPDAAFRDLPEDTTGRIFIHS